MSDFPVAATTVIDLFSPEPKQRTSSPRPARAAASRAAKRREVVPAVAAAAPNGGIIELLSDDDEGDKTAAPLRRTSTPSLQQQPTRKRQRQASLKDYGEDGRKRKARPATPSRGEENNIIDLLSESSGSAAAKQAPASSRASPEFQVLEVFPDADLEGIKTLLQSYNKVEVVVAVMFEKGYKKTSAKTTPLLLQQQNGISVSGPEEKEWSYDFMASDSFSPSTPYVRQSKQQLMYDFLFLSSAGVDAILQRNGNHYAKAHDAVVTALKGTGDDETKFHRLDKVLRGSLPDADQAERLNTFKAGAVLKRKSSRKRMLPRVSDPILQEEMKYAQGKLEVFLANGRKRDSIEKKQQRAKASNTALECSCCYDGYDIDDMVACSCEGHLFCVDCLKQYAESQLFGVGNLGVDRATKKPAHELKCFHGECLSGFDRQTLEKALPERTLKKYDEIQFNISLQAAGLANLVSCPKCEFQAELPYDQKFLVCPVESCKYESCRECGEAAHIGIRCDEVEKEAETKGRVTVEEAISQAKIRHCPKCKKAFLKESGCNKMTCGCGTKSCYVCRQIIKDYSHFCQKPHCQHQKCKKCPLWTNAEEVSSITTNEPPTKIRIQTQCSVRQDDKRAMKEAGIKAASQVSSTNVDVNSILKSPPQSRQK